MTILSLASLDANARVTRADWAQLRALIEERQDAQEPVLLDFSGVRVAPVSFLDEALGIFARAHGTEVLLRHVQVQNFDPGDRSLLHRIVASRAREREQFSSEGPRPRGQPRELGGEPNLRAFSLAGTRWGPLPSVV